MKKIIYFLILGLISVAVGCKGGGTIFVDDEYDILPKEIVTLTPSGVSLDKATLRGSSSLGGDQISERGFYVSTAEIDINNIDDSGSEDVAKYPATNIKGDVFTCDIKDLKLGQKHYFVAFIRHATGVHQFGEQKYFMSDNLAIEPATPPTAQLNDNDHSSAKIIIHLSDFGTKKLTGPDSWLAKVNDVGIYLWEDGVGTLETATRIQYSTEENRLKIRQSSYIGLGIVNLKPMTKYYYVPYLTIGVYRDYDPNGVALMNEVVGIEGNFTMDATPIESPQPLL